MKSKILLITSNFEEVSLFNASYKQPTGVKPTKCSHYPLGIAYLHSYLESCGHNVRSLCLNHTNDETCFRTVVEKVEKLSPEIVALQILSPNRLSSYCLIEAIHERYPRIQLVVGGIHTTIMYRQLLARYPFLIAVLGEGEITFSELIEELGKKNPNLMSIDGLAFIHNNSIIKTKPRKLIEDLDILPFPKHELFFDGQRHSGSLITSRGCPFNCSFCCLGAISNRRVRYRSVKNVVDEIEYMIKQFPEMTQIWIHDDSFFLDNQRVIEICDEIIRRKIKMNFVCSGRMKPLSKKMVMKLEQANFELVLFGLESGNEAILHSCHKVINKKDALNAFQLFSDSPIGLFAFLIVGLPGETLKTIMETINFVKKLQKIKYVSYRNMAILSVYPGTEIYEIAKAHNMIDDDFWFSDKPVPLFTVEHSQKQLFDFKEIMLNHLSLDRFWTKAGFKAQWPMLPYIIPYLIKQLLTVKRIISILTRWLKSILPKRIYQCLRKQYRFISAKKIKDLKQDIN